jgi:hypothetical protein
MVVALRECRKCGKYLESAEELSRGICGDCFAKAIYTEQELLGEMDVALTVKKEVRIVNLTLREGDYVEITVGRNQVIRGVFRGFSSKLYALHIECDDRDIVIPYKYIKSIVKFKR